MNRRVNALQADEMVGTREKDEPGKRHEVVGFSLAVLAAFILLALLSYSGKDGGRGTDLVGSVGRHLAYFGLDTVGIGIYFLDIALWITALSLVVGRRVTFRPLAATGLFAVMILGSIAAHVWSNGALVHGGHPAGGIVGETLGEISRSLFADTGTLLLASAGIVVILVLVTNFSIWSTLKLMGRFLAVSAILFSRIVRRIAVAWIAAAARYRERQKEKRAAEPTIQMSSQASETIENPKEIIVKPAAAETSVEPSIVESKVKKVVRRKAKDPADAAGEEMGAQKDGFELPPLEFLSRPSENEDPSIVVDAAALKETAVRLVKVLSDFSVIGEVREIYPGPVVTMYEFVPNSGTKLSKIEGLSSEVAMALEVNKVRVVAPIPGKNAVGFEIPNKTRQMVYLGPLIADEGFRNGKLLPLALGKDINGRPYYVDLAKMPHLLVAGTTGSGKSVSVNAMILSLLYRYTPNDIRFLMIDPKVIELGVYEGIPHLLLPVVTDMNKAALALKWAIDEMERRYQLFAEVGARNLGNYNRKVQNPEAIETERPVTLLHDSEEKKEYRPLPFIIVVIDELADLMMAAARDVETAVARLAQKARASGIHLMVSTQRPSTDVITGLIKANFPSRISFRVSSSIDSRTILNQNGGETLLGNGDMLIVPPGSPDLVRVHGAFVSDEEIKKVVSFLKQQGTPQYDESILKPREDEEGPDEEDFSDDLYDKAVAMVAESRLASISLVQRRLRIGYNRAARMIERMEREGVVGKANGSSPREVLISPQ